MYETNNAAKIQPSGLFIPRSATGIPLNPSGSVTSAVVKALPVPPI